ncbi:MAG TPA: DUF2520 domain-containing protein [Acidimicrobiales bacterium]|nr:DUF2520 domain-containing protein [Acidimicrobiales bacterium]
MSTIRVLGAGRAGRSFSLALSSAGHRVLGPLTRADDPLEAATGTDALVLAVPDDELAHVAASIRPSTTCCVIHLSGSLGLDVLDPHPRRASMHPLVPLPNAAVGAARLGAGVTMAIAGDPLAGELAASLGATPVSVADEDRAAYHAAACVAANHVVALLGQVERIAATIGLPLEAYLGLSLAALEDVRALGPRGALTGPARRGDWATIARHLDALDEAERAGYGAGVALALELAASDGAVVAPPATVADTTR